MKISTIFGYVDSVHMALGIWNLPMYQFCSAGQSFVLSKGVKPTVRPEVSKGD